MSVADYSLTIFVALNVARAIAYWPQIVSIHRDPDRAIAVSLSTWIIFTAANVATVIYALMALEALVVAAVFGVNAVGCAAIVMFTAYKRFRHRLPVWTNICEKLLPEPDRHPARCERIVVGAAPGEHAHPSSTSGRQSLTAESLVASMPVDGATGAPFREASKHPRSALRA